MPKILFVIDAYNLIYRMFYAIPEMTTRHGTPVNAIFWVAKFLKSLADENPDASLIVATDVWQSFRSDLYSEYKAQRDRMPDNLRSQIEGVFALFDTAGITVLAREGYEADDIIGSIAHKYENNWYQIVIISSDKDLCQFVRDGHVHIYDAMKRKFMKESDVVEKFGVPAHQVCDYLAIVGDSSDNIPGIAGFGPKKAVDLLERFSSLAGIYDELWVVNYELWMDGKVKYFLDSEKYEKSELSPKLKQWLLDNIDNAFLSQKLATIYTDLELDALPEVAFVSGLSNPEYTSILKQYEFKSLLPRESTIPVPVKNIDIVDITTYEKLQSIHGEILIKSLPMVIAVDEYSKIVFSLDWIIYRIDTKKVDAGELIDDILTEKISLIWYDLKDVLKRLYTIKKPTEVVGDEGQGRLF